MFKKQPDYTKQLEEILNQTENRLDLETVQSLSRLIAIFHLSLLEQGVEKNDAVEITKQYISEVFNSARK